jgi:hypothetical protein
MGSKTLILVRGLSGSGKTDLADIIVGDIDERASIAMDDYFYDDEGNFKFVPEELKTAHEWCLRGCEAHMKDGLEVVVVHNIFTRKWEVDPYLSIAKDNGYRVHIINLYDRGMNDYELSEQSDHNINPGLIQRQRKRWDKDVYRDKVMKPQRSFYDRSYDRGYDRGYRQRKPWY